MKHLDGSQMRSRCIRLLMGAGLLALSTAASAPAFAQPESGQSPAPSTEPAASAFANARKAPADMTGSAAGEIVVTAQKRSEKLQDVPISISAVTSQQLQQRNIAQVAQISQSVPALRIDYAGNTVQPTIRGVGSQVAGPGFISNIPIYVDGYYIPSPGSSDINLVDVDSLSVLKGPQGTLFGYNATGGAIQITTKQPEFDTSGLIRFGYGSYQRVNSAFYGTTGLTDTLAVSLASSYEHGNGYVRNIVTGDKHAGEFRNYSFRPKILWKPADGVSFLLT